MLVWIIIPKVVLDFKRKTKSKSEKSLPHCFIGSMVKQGKQLKAQVLSGINATFTFFISGQFTPLFDWIYITSSWRRCPCNPSSLNWIYTSLLNLQCFIVAIYKISNSVELLITKNVCQFCELRINLFLKYNLRKIRFINWLKSMKRQLVWFLRHWYKSAIYIFLK